MSIACIQATGGTDSRVLLFDSSDFTEGGIHSPTTSVYIGPDGNDVTGLAWLPGQLNTPAHGRLVPFLILHLVFIA